MSYKYRCFRNYVIQPDKFTGESKDIIKNYDLELPSEVNKPEMIEILNLGSSVYSSPGYLMQFDFGALFKNQLFSIDGLQSTIFYEEQKFNSPIPKYVKLNVRRVTGPEVSMGYIGQNTTWPDNGNRVPGQPVGGNALNANDSTDVGNDPTIVYIRHPDILPSPAVYFTVVYNWND